MEEKAMIKPPERWYLLAFSAQTHHDLDTLTEKLAALLQENAELALEEVAPALIASYGEDSIRRTLVCHNRQEALETLRLHDTGKLLTGEPQTRHRPIAFLFPGLGEQYEHMGQQLYLTEPVFRKYIDDSDELLRPFGLQLKETLYPTDTQQEHTPSQEKLDLRRLLRRTASTSRLNQTALAQPATFAIEYALAQLLFSWGIHPHALLGYSIGEYVAACLAGVFSFPDAVRLVAARAQLIERLPHGSMLAVPLSEQEITPLLGNHLSLAALNGDALSIVAGPSEAVSELERLLQQRDIVTIRLNTAHAFHSHMMKAIASEFEDVVRTCTLQAPRIPYLSNVTGTWITPEQATDPGYWATHLHQPVRFADGLQALWKQPEMALLEVGPGQTLCSLALQARQNPEQESVTLPTMRAAFEHLDDRAFLLNTIGKLWLTGVPLNWNQFYQQKPDYTLPQLLRTTVEPPEQETSEARKMSRRRKPKQKRTRPWLTTDYVPPSGEREQALVSLWQRILHIDGIGIHDSFFELGGHSLLALRILEALKKTYGVELPLSSLFEAPTVAQFARVLDDALRGEHHQHNEAQPAAFTGPALHYQLPNGLKIMHQNKAETDHFYEDIFVHRAYTSHLPELPQNACVFDVGANIGLFTLFLHSLNRGIQIYAFEPSPPTFEVLSRNIALHKVNARLFPFGLSDTARTAEFTFYPFSTGMSSFYANRAEEEEVLTSILQNQYQQARPEMEQVMRYAGELVEERLKSQTFVCKLHPLSAVMKENAVERIDLLKIDVQKSELDVLRGIADEDWNKIHSIVAEVHNLHGQLDTITNLLKAHGYTLTVQQDELYKGSVIYLLYASRP
ncbi:hypothetical protein KTH_62100 [Thermosporothrix hazakensis]|nr:hypothetical protein KTH_62100 [Thermosporothrix hazakensis]